MARPGCLGNEHLDLPPDHRGPAMAEQHLGLVVEQSDLPAGVDDDDGVGQ
jgi:hypothetical protein